MSLRLSTEQEQALVLDRPVCLAAGAGSGKTGVLIERYLRAVEDVGFDLDAVLAVTFTRKATAEVLGRVRTEISDRIRGGGPQAPAWQGVRERLSDAWIMTIDAFCYRVLSTMGPAAGRPPERRILTGGALVDIMNEAMRQVIDRIADAPDDPDYESLRVLLRELGRADLASHLALLIERRARAHPWSRMMLAGPGADPARIVAAVARLSGRLPPAAGAADREQHALQVALARLFERVLSRYRELLAAAHGCDFRQLLEDVADLFQDERVRRRWAERFRHVLVDEFQDTDPLQWAALRKLFGADGIERPGLFIVGDEKQAIFSFRDGDVATLREAGREIAAAGGAQLSLADNYRSTPELVAFFNRLSEVLFSGATEEFEARHAAMEVPRAGGDAPRVASRVEILVGRSDDPGRARRRELDAIAARIVQFVDDGTPVGARGSDGTWGVRPASFEDQAILLRARTRLSELEDVLTAHGIPFRVLGGVGFFEQHEVAALCNVMRFLADDGDDLALLGVLRSPLFALPDSVLLAAARRSSTRRRALWEKLCDLSAAVRGGETELPTQGDGPVLLDAITRLERYRKLADRLPANELLALVVRESDLMLTLGVVDPSGRSGANVEKLLHLARRCRADGVATLDEIERTIALARRSADSPEAQADPPGSSRRAVSILTVHAAKGLEWPIVFVPNMTDGGNAWRHETAPPARLRADVGLPFLHEVALDDGRDRKKPPLHEALSKLTRLERTAEAKRLLYVAATRARDHLVLSGALKGTDVPERDSWLAWALSAGDESTTVVDPVPAAAPALGRTHPLFERGGPVVGSPVFIPPRPAAPVLVVPATALATLRECPRRFFLEQMIGATGAASVMPGAAGSVGSPDLDPRVRGSIVHAALEGIAIGVDPASRVAAIASGVGLADPERVSVLEDEVRKAVGRFREWPEGRRIIEGPPGSVSSEVPFELGQGNWRVTGVVDLLWTPENGGAVVVDFKTDRGAPRALAEAIGFARAHGYVDQLSAYAAAVQRRYGDPVSVWLFFTESGLAVPVAGEGTDLPAAACMASIERLLAQSVAAAAGGFPLTEDPATCRRCPHRATETCPGVLGKPEPK